MRGSSVGIEIVCFDDFRLTVELGVREQKLADLNRKFADEQKVRLQAQQMVSAYQVRFGTVMLPY